MKRTVLLIVLDGWGIGAQNETNPVYIAGPPTFKWIAEHFPMTSLQASGISVGLPWGEVGNSEVGHLTLGAGKVVYQYFPRITIAIQNKTFFENSALKSAFAHARDNNSSINFVGLLTKGSTHAALDHLLALIQMAERENVPRVKLHLWADAKDSPPRSLNELLAKIPRDKLSTLMGRYYSMNRSDNWNLTEKAYGCLVGATGQVTDDIQPVIDATYTRNLTEEFLPPIRLNQRAGIEENDSVVFFNFREDSMRQIGEAFVSKSFDKFPVKPFKNLNIVTMTQYKKEFPVQVAFPPDLVEHPLGRVISDAGMNQLRIAETYKHAHVTFFFNGHREDPFKDEYHVLIPSLHLTHPDEHPELMARAITDRLLEVVQNQAFDFVLANYSNADTIAHTGNYNASVDAVKVIDGEIGRLLKGALHTETQIIITSDHGNVEELINPRTGEPETQHDPNPVPLYLIGQEFQNKKFVNWRAIESEPVGILSDVAPTVLELMGIAQPEEMTGTSLLKNLLA